MPPEPSAAQYSQPMPTDMPSVFSGAQNVLRDSIVAAMENSNASVISTFQEGMEGLAKILSDGFKAMTAAAQAPPAPPAQPPVQPPPPPPPSTVVHVPSTSHATPKFREPRLFDGKVSSVTPFLAEIGSAIFLQSHALNTDRLKTVYFSMYLKDGSPRSWYYMIEHDPSKSHLLDDYDLFLESFKKHFGDSNRHATALAAMKNLVQTGSCAAFASRFRELLVDLDYTERHKIDEFRAKLKSHVKDAIAYRGNANLPTSFDDFVALCIDLDDTGHQRASERLAESKHAQKQSSHSSKSSSNSKFNSNSSTNQPAAAAAAPVASSSDVVPMEIDAIRRGPLSAEEKQRRRNLGLCLYCGQGKHLVPDCPNMSERAKRNRMAKPSSGKA